MNNILDKKKRHIGEKSSLGVIYDIAYIVIDSLIKETQTRGCDEP